MTLLGAVLFVVGLAVGRPLLAVAGLALAAVGAAVAWRSPPWLTPEELAELDDARDGPHVRKVPR